MMNNLTDEARALLKANPHAGDVQAAGNPLGRTKDAKLVSGGEPITSKDEAGEDIYRAFNEWEFDLSKAQSKTPGGHSVTHGAWHEPGSFHNDHHFWGTDDHHHAVKHHQGRKDWHEKRSSRAEPYHRHMEQAHTLLAHSKNPNEQFVHATCPTCGTDEADFAKHLAHHHAQAAAGHHKDYQKS